MALRADFAVWSYVFEILNYQIRYVRVIQNQDTLTRLAVKTALETPALQVPDLKSWCWRD